jgi:hypothetical protein
MQQYTMFDREVFEMFVRLSLGEIIEVRAMDCFGYGPAWSGRANGILSGYFDSFQKLCKAVMLLMKAAEQLTKIQIYMTLQVIDPALLGRSRNELGPGKHATKDDDVLYYRWLPIDLDPVRKSNISSSDEELEQTRLLSDDIADQLGKEGWPAPLRAMSGNGYHLLYPIQDLPAQNEDVRKIIRTALSELSTRFSNERVHLDTTLYNPSRIIKLYGTTARKGSSVPAGLNRVARPHRQSYIFNLGT